MLQNDLQLESTREKLRLLEESYEEICQETGSDEELREAEMESVSRFIKQLKEEISRLEIHRDPRAAKRRVLTDVELTNTRGKLSELERMFETNEHDMDGDDKLRQLSMKSLQKLINQLKEEIIWTEVHQSVPH